VPGFYVRSSSRLSRLPGLIHIREVIVPIVACFTAAGARHAPHVVGHVRERHERECATFLRTLLETLMISGSRPTCLILRLIKRARFGNPVKVNVQASAPTAKRYIRFLLRSGNRCRGRLLG